MSKKFFLVVLIIVLINTSVVLGCNFHNMIPLTDSSDFLDTIYIEYEMEIPEDLKSYLNSEDGMIETYIYIIQAKEFLFIENAMASIPGLYVIKNDNIDNIKQDEINLDIININLKNGETIQLDTMNQMLAEQNAFYVEEVEGVLYLDVKSEYAYLYEINEALYGEMEEASEDKYDFVDEAGKYVDRRDNMAEELFDIEKEDKTEIMEESRTFFQTYWIRFVLGLGIMFLGILYGIVVNGKNIG